MAIDTVIFISNPFGFGPAGKTIILIQELRRKWNGRIVYIASQKCLDILPRELRDSIDVIEADERNPDDLSNILVEFVSAMVVVVLNRSAVHTARSLGMKTFFVDSLSWMWDEIPSEYLSANIYYYYNIFGTPEQLSDLENARSVSPILGALPSRQIGPRNILIHIGGFSNPFAKDNEGYLCLLADLINKIDSNYNVTVAGGKSSIDFLAKISRDKNTEFVVVGRDAFLKKLAQSERFITTSGSTAVFEAFAIGTPTVFLPPTNLSQWKQLRLLSMRNAAPLQMAWEKYTDVPNNLDLLSEKEALNVFARLPETILNTPTVNKMHTDFLTLISVSADFSDQNALISKTLDGASVIISDILKVVVPSKG